MSNTKLTTMLDTGTQTILMRDAYDAHCRCGRGLTWVRDNTPDPALSGKAKCQCGMSYTAWLPVIKIEGVDLNAL